MLDQTRLDYAASALLSVFEAADVERQLIGQLLEHEFERSVGEEGAILRGNSLCTKMVLAHSHARGTAYLRSLLGPWLARTHDKASAAALKG